MIYFDHAVSSPLRSEAKAAMNEVLDLFGNPSSPHFAGLEARKRIEFCRKQIADLLGCEPGEVIFTSGGTESDATVLHSILLTGKTGLVTSPIEHHAVLKNIPRGITPVLLPIDRNGVILPSDLEAALTPQTGLVSVQTVNQELGTIQPVNELCELAHDRGALFHTDAVQAVGQTEIDFSGTGADYLSASAHKFGGPKGVGVLLCRKGSPFAPLLSGGMQENGRRAGTESLLLITGMTAALQAAITLLPAEAERKTELRTFLEAGAEALGAIPLCKNSARAPGITDIFFPGHDAEALLYALDLHGICVSAGAACETGQTSHVLKAIGLTETEARSCIRFSFGGENTLQEVRSCLTLLKEIL